MNRVEPAEQVFVGDGQHDHRLVAVYYVLAVLVLSLYGIRVCPFIAGLDAAHVLVTFLVGFLAAFLIKLGLENRLMPEGEPFTLSVYQFFIDFALFLAVGLGIALYNHFVLGFPLESGGKVLIGCATFGIFAGLDNGLRRERRSPAPLSALTVSPKRIFPITDRLFVIFISIAVFTSIVTGLVIIKDIDYLIAHLNDAPHAALRRAVFIDIGFVIGVVLALAMRLLWSYGNNLAYILQLQIAGLVDVSSGKLDTFVPIITRDEFSLIAAKTNRMIAHLRDAHREQNELFEVSLALATELRLEPLLARIVATTRSFVGADRVSLFLHDPHSDELWGKIAEGIEDVMRFPASSGIAGDAFTRVATVRVADAYSDPRFNPEFDRRSGYRTRSLLCVPVEDRHGRCIGVIQALNKHDGEFSESDANRLRAFAAQAAIALVNAQLFSDLDRARRYNESILRSLSNGVVTLDADLKVVKANAAAQALLGVDDQIHGQPFQQALGESRSWWETLCGGVEQAYLSEAELQLGSGKHILANITRVPLADLEDRAIGSMLVIEDVTEEKRVRNTLSRYLPTQVAEQVLLNPALNLGGVAQTATVLFSDIRDFTTLSEQLGARATVTMLNEYFSAMVEAISAHDGILDKYIGDAVMALFGVPFAGAHDADSAVRAAIAMQERLQQLNRQRTDRGEDPLAIGIGLSTGELVAGNVGSPRRMDYTVIGDTVNLASRLEAATKLYGVAVIVSEGTRAALQKDHPLRELDRVRVKGKLLAATVYQLMTESERLDEAALKLFADARGKYSTRDWQGAVLGFRELLSRFPEDGPSKVFIERCLAFQQNPPAADWDGVWPPH
ncbi:adenylate/guanylate cyclase domain-containing protein [Pseudomarimonas arenosa]|uniref:GAF domain-containing protein n=1 Tax=Pseudomarimonas arenosa TaxID=2774145 RepID=A0AAW3ZQX8_9GAMM|nr:adenylate/guanylate cyclase domain-containing protein [Pseudomarimonas arenosa]MBD8527945.1 GAF domain-containing protein [Pseudomarimonas arenosa]